MNRRDILLGIAAAASASILPKAVAAAPEPIRIMTPVQHMAARPDMYARPIFVAVRSGEEPTKAAFLTRLRRSADQTVMADVGDMIQQVPERPMLFVDCGNLSPLAAHHRVQDVRAQVLAGVPFEIANLPPKLASGAPAW